AGQGAEEAEGQGVMSYLSHHLVDSRTVEIPIINRPVTLPVLFPSLTLPNSMDAHGFLLTKHRLGLVIAALLVIILVIPGMGRTRRGDVPHGFGNFLEVLVVFVRDEVVYPNIGPEKGRKWLPVFLTAFFLILFSNLLGMLPWGTTPTGNVNVTGGLAIAMLLSVFYAGIREHGLKYIATFVPHGVPILIVPLLFPIEVFGLFVKHFALCIRLFANMLAGHTVIGVFLALILTPLVAFASVPGAVAIGLLEIFVAFLQSYIFIMLASLFVGMAIHPEH
ncbi:MAG TPA: ATP synthase F0 subunit A, partial [Bacteroidetes bacterium]|nr:ATP synthase F0 subunit A [Bacteroidota bacterium]